MKITYRQTGGFAGLSKSCKLDTRTLDVAEQAAVQALVDKSGILKHRSVHRTSPMARDTFNYRIIIENEDGKHDWELDDLTVGEEHLPLITFLRAKAVIAKRD
jgi:hypothetical protein